MKGLSAKEAAERLLRDGPNSLPSADKSTLLAICREMLKEPMFVLLIAAGSLYLVLGDVQEGTVLFVLVLLVLALTIYQEGKTARAIEALRDLSSPRALVLREDRQQRVAGSDVVVGDILVLAEGDRVAADADLLEGADIQMDESLLTGESTPVDKSVEVQTHATPSKAVNGQSMDRLKSRLYSGTVLLKGHGLARVTATGEHSEIGRIGAALDTVTETASPLKQQTARLVKVLALIALAASLFMVLAFGLVRGDWLGAFLAGIALAMALLPQEFTVILTVLPALGAWRLSKERVLVRHINAIETLGATSVLCVDKTGTLTENQMTVAQLYSHVEPAQTLAIDYAKDEALPEPFHTLVEYSILASMVDPFDPMDKAFHRLGQHYLQGTEHLHRDWTLVREYGLNPELRAMSHVWKAQVGDSFVVAAKGAPEAIMDLCHLDDSDTTRINQAVNAMAAKGLRVLGVAQARFVGDTWPKQEHDFQFAFVGLLGLADPLRPGIPEAVAQCHSAGIRVLMITGDYPMTARAIASQAALDCSTDKQLLTGADIAQLSALELQARLKEVSVCARVAPEQKLRIVQALQADGQVVAMTGDGVNDAPALKAAHVGIAMGERGTDVAREAADLVLLDDNFASIVRAVRLGRRIFDNLRKSMSYVVAVHIPIAGMALVPVLMGWPVVLFPLHIAFLELVIDPACSMVFENEPPEGELMQHSPRSPDTQLFGGWTLAVALLQGLGVSLMVGAAYLWSREHMAEPLARAFTFTTLVSSNLTLIFSNRSRTASMWKTLWIPNRTLWLVTGVTAVVLGLTLYVPSLASLFKFGALPMEHLLLAALAGCISMVWFSVLKRGSFLASKL
ncbi:cation-translocating P-type ATPase [Rhodoferax aquaticus]|uniref:Cation-translocating P-type ATPase n=1 Tax=Rhodoferax aquaticus TaxID=2527691 RepID=A0A515EQ45_9BURK|nr:cation-translocating P-type ATPase [Rhodoferax aquaticus]QDL54750.1 cation-translocating P-type ATPase [Rhodoferax aquaticus]